MLGERSGQLGWVNLLGQSSGGQKYEEDTHLNVTKDKKRQIEREKEQGKRFVEKSHRKTETETE